VLPDVPAIAEEIPGYEATGFFGIAASRKVPKPLVERLHREFNAVLALPEIQKSFAKHGLEIEIMTIPQFSEYLERDAKRWSDLVRKAGLVF